MRVFVTGATGFVGRQLAMRLRREGHEVIAWVRDEVAAAAVLGVEPSPQAQRGESIELLSTRASDAALAEALGRCGGVINLAGAPIGRRIGPSYAEVVRSSRVDTTERIVRAIASLPAASRPAVLVSTSAVGYYGDAGDRLLDEESPAGEGFFAELAQAWESAALGAEHHGVRVSLLRVAVVLGPEGGALGALVPIFAWGLGGRVGSGRQWMPWVHMEDLVDLYIRALHDPDFAGVSLACAPEPVTNRGFTAALGRALERPTLFPVPAFALRLALARGAAALLASTRTVPTQTLARGFEFRHDDLDAAIADVLDHRGVHIRALGRSDPRPDHPYIQSRRPTHLLEQETWIEAPIEEVFPFFSAAHNLGAITPPALGFRILTPTPIVMAEKRVIDYAIKLGVVPMRWRTVIERWAPGEAFVDAQHRGPYRCWYHEHLFESHGDRTRMIDRVWFASPFGPLGRITNHLFIFSMLRRIFGFRARVIEQRFGAAPARTQSSSSDAA